MLFRQNNPLDTFQILTMRKFILTSQYFEGSVTFGFSDDGWLTLLHNEAVFNDKQHSWLFEDHRFPKRIERVELLTKLIKGVLTEVPPDIGFDVFWSTYDKKINKKRAEPLYNKLSDADKMKAITTIKPYQKYCERVKRGIADPEKYLRDLYFETDWTKQR